MPLLDFYLPMMKTAALVSAGRLGLFEALAEGPLSVNALAKALTANEMGVQALADYLVLLGYLQDQGGMFALTPHAERWFTSRGIADYTAGLLWTGEAWEIMSTLTDAIKKGGPEKILWERMLECPPMGSLFSRYMRVLAQHLAPDFLERIPLPEGPIRILDLGGSHGLHSLGFCHRYPDLCSVIVDLPQALADTESLVEQEGLSDRISILPGNLSETNWGNGYDAVFYFAIAHNQTSHENRTVIRRIWEALRPGGIMAIHEYLADPQLSMHNAAFRLTLLTETGTRTYSFADFSEWLTEAGFESITRVQLDPSEKGTLIIARR